MYKSAILSSVMSTKLRISLTIIAAVIVVGGGVAIVSRILTDEKDTPTTNGPTSAASQKTYVALGDSVAAGVGLRNDSDSSACDRTDQSYPHQLANLDTATKYKLINLACRGATLAAGINGPQDVNRLAVKPQLEQLFAQPKPDIVTLTIGANDANWVRFITSCYAANCATPAQSAAFAAQLPVISSAYQQALKSIETHYAQPGTKPPQVLVTDYYHLYPAAATNCADTAGVDANEQQWVRQQITLLNDSIMRVVEPFEAFASFVRIDFTGHEACSSDPYIQGINDKEPFHPTASGQGAIARQISKQIK